MVEVRRRTQRLWRHCSWGRQSAELVQERRTMTSLFSLKCGSEVQAHGLSVKLSKMLPRMCRRLNKGLSRQVAARYWPECSPSPTLGHLCRTWPQPALRSAPALTLAQRLKRLREVLGVGRLALDERAVKVLKVERMRVQRLAIDELGLGALLAAVERIA